MSDDHSKWIEKWGLRIAIIMNLISMILNTISWVMRKHD